MLSFDAYSREHCVLTLLHSERSKLYGVLTALSAIGVKFIDEHPMRVTLLHSERSKLYGVLTALSAIGVKFIDEHPMRVPNARL